jgi:hypothetical protein
VQSINLPTMASRRPLLDLVEDDDMSFIPQPQTPPQQHTQTNHHHTAVHQPHQHTTAYVEHNIKIPYLHAFDNMRLDKFNLRCFDCGNNQTSWVSLYLGIFLCLKCAGEHRGLGVHVSVIRSVNLDTWTPSKLLFMLLGGNTRASEFFAQRDPALLTASIQVKYNSATAAEYRQLLQSEQKSTLQSLEQRGIVQPTPERLSSDQPSSPSLPPPNMQKYAGATSISSDQFFGEKKKKSRGCCC